MLGANGLDMSARLLRPNQKIRVLIADDHEIVREGLVTLLSEEPQFKVVGQATNGAEAVALTTKLRPYVVLMDLMMPVMDGIEATRRIRQAHASTQVIALTSFTDDEHVREALRVGAIGYLLKDVLKPDLLRAIRSAAEGKPTLHPEVQRSLMQQTVQLQSPVQPTSTASAEAHSDLTARERQVLQLIGQGRSNKEIAAALQLTEGTVKGYVSAILAKLTVADRTQAALYAVKHNLVNE
jgi:DNA-binding NarL/FixJ family response regulator